MHNFSGKYLLNEENLKSRIFPLQIHPPSSLWCLLSVNITHFCIIKLPCRRGLAGTPQNMWKGASPNTRTSPRLYHLRLSQPWSRLPKCLLHYHTQTSFIHQSQATLPSPSPATSNHRETSLGFEFLSIAATVGCCWQPHTSQSVSTDAWLKGDSLQPDNTAAF